MHKHTHSHTHVQLHTGHVQGFVDDSDYFFDVNYFDLSV
jgi:hypothetical protein